MVVLCMFIQRFERSVLLYPVSFIQMITSIPRRLESTEIQFLSQATGSHSLSSQVLG
jgi:hypothetical protein